MLEHASKLREFADEVRAEGFTDALLLGMGGSSLGPEVIRRSFGDIPDGLRLQVLDSTHPDVVLAAQDAVDLDKTLFIVSSKSGGTIETLSHYRYFKQFARPEQFVVVTDPGSPLERLAGDDGLRRCFLNPPDIGGRYSVLSYFGLVPAAMMGLPIFDTTLVTIMRTLEGRPLAQGGRDHLSHRLVAVGLSERQSVLVLYIMAACFGSLGLVARSAGVWLSLLLAGVFLVIAILFGLDLLAYAMYVLLAVIIVSRFLSRKWAQSLAATRECNRLSAEIGDSVAVVVTLKNTGRWPVAWVLLEDLLPRDALLFDPPRLKIGGRRVQLSMLRGLARKTMLYQVTPTRRGYYQLGPLVLETGDLFGLHRRYRVRVDVEGDRHGGVAEPLLNHLRWTPAPSASVAQV